MNEKINVTRIKSNLNEYRVRLGVIDPNVARSPEAPVCFRVHADRNPLDHRGISLYDEQRLERALFWRIQAVQICY